METIAQKSVVAIDKRPGLEVVMLTRPEFVEYYITACPVGVGSPFSMFEAVADFVREHDAVIVIQDVFGPCKFYKDAMTAIESFSGKIDWPVAWMEGDGYVANSITSTQVYAISGTTVEPILIDGRTVGAVFEDSDAKYCMLGDIRPGDLTASRFDQAYDVFVKMETALATVGMDFSNVVRTWLYASKILEWYGDLNKARDRFFRERNVFDHLVPASTGVGMLNPAGVALIADVQAVRAKRKNVRVEKIESPLQCSALDYKSSFSRAVEIRYADHAMLLVSGTASIEPGGATAHVGDIKKQIALSMEVVYGILKSRGMGWRDVSRATVYFKDIKEAPLFHDYCMENKIPLMPVAVAHADICRDDLLFEIELDALKVSDSL